MVQGELFARAFRLACDLCRSPYHRLDENVEKAFVVRGMKPEASTEPPKTAGPIDKSAVNAGTVAAILNEPGRTETGSVSRKTPRILVLPDVCAARSIAADQVQRVSVPDDVDAVIALHEHDALGILGALSCAHAVVGARRSSR